MTAHEKSPSDCDPEEASTRYENERYFSLAPDGLDDGLVMASLYDDIKSGKASLLDLRHSHYVYFKAGQQNALEDDSARREQDFKPLIKRHEERTRIHEARGEKPRPLPPYITSDDTKPELT